MDKKTKTILNEGIRLAAEGYYLQHYKHKKFGKIREWFIKLLLRYQLKAKNRNYHL